MTSKAKVTGGATTIICAACGHETSGPDSKSVNEAHKRHQAKTGHK